MTSSKKPLTPDPAAGRPANAYARFIPREEIGSFASWQPGDIGDPNATDPLGRRRTSGSASAETHEAPSIEQQLQLARQQGYQDGYRDGMAALELFKQTWGLQLSQQFSTLVTHTQAALADLERDMADTLVDAAMGLARQVIRRELDVKPELVATVANEAVDTLMHGAKHIQMRLHPEDIPLVHQSAQDLLTARGVRLVPDAQLSRGGCLIDSDLGTVNATVEERWRAACQHLAQPQDWATAPALATSPTPATSPASLATPATPVQPDEATFTQPLQEPAP